MVYHPSARPRNPAKSAPATPSQLLRILRSYERNESMKLDVLRDHKRETVTGKLGDKGER